MAEQNWKKNLGFLESIMFDPVTSGILGLGEGIMSLFSISEKNSQIDALKDEYEKMKYSEDAMSRRENRVKQVFGNLSNSMIGASQYLNGDTMRAMQNSKLATESAKGMLDQRMRDEQTNLGITDKINQLEGQKSGYIPSIMGMLSGGLQGVFGATQSSMAMDQKEQQNDLLRSLMGNEPSGTATGVTNPITGNEVYIPEKTNAQSFIKDFQSLSNATNNYGMIPQDETSGKMNFAPLTQNEYNNKNNPLANWTAPQKKTNLLPNINNMSEDLLSLQLPSSTSSLNSELKPLDNYAWINGAGFGGMSQKWIEDNNDLFDEILKTMEKKGKIKNLRLKNVNVGGI